MELTPFSERPKAIGMASEPESRRGRPLLRLGPKKEGTAERVATIEEREETEDDEEAASLLTILLATADSRA